MTLIEVGSVWCCPLETIVGSFWVTNLDSFDFFKYPITEGEKVIVTGTEMDSAKLMIIYFTTPQGTALAAYEREFRQIFKLAVE